ncbi:transposase, partial [Flavobacterium sp.]|uniref:transposase n=1 Tax=Flavobacterium sp. TaxID=239 RepID=UPI0038FD2237
MTEKFQNKYRIPSARLKNWDYGTNGAYFITICTQNRDHFFGDFMDSEFITSEIGTLAEKYWMEIPQHFPYIELGNFVVMPNHVHGILIIDKNVVKTLHCPVQTLHCPVQTLQCNVSENESPVQTLQCPVQTLQCNVSIPNKNKQMANISPKSGTISAIMRSYKSVVTKNARFIHADFGWQPRFHDHIIRNAPEWERIQTYIENNPMNWKEDKFYL